MNPSSKTENWLAHLPVSLFASVMGLGGWTLATIKAHQLWASAWLGALSVALGVLTALVFLGLVLLYGVKALRHPQALRGEWNHPIKLAFFPAVSIGLLLLAAIFAALWPQAHRGAQLVWLLGSALHLSLTLAIISRWMHRDGYQIAHANPAWFIPVVGNIVAPLAGVELGFVELSGFFFAVGIFMWLPMLALILNRLFFHPAMPPKLLPTLFILLAPPTLGMLSWLKLHGGVFDDFARLLYSFAVFTALLLLTQWPYFRKLPFALPWWALSFPLAAFTTATMVMTQHHNSPWMQIVCAALYAALTLVMLTLITKTLRAAQHGKICVPD